MDLSFALCQFNLPSCDKQNLSRVFKLQKRAARVISDANNQASSVKLFNSLQWLPFYEEVKIAKCCVAYKRIKGEVPLYIEDSLRLNSQQHSRVTRYSNINLFPQSLIGSPKAVGRSQFLLANSGTA